MVKKNTPAVETPKVLDETEQDFVSIEAEVRTVLGNDALVKVLKRLVYEIATVGLSEEEACMIVNFDKTKLLSLKEKFPIVRRLFEVKKLEYKRGLMKTISNKANMGDEKLSMWLLESQFPEEFNKRKGAGGGVPSEDMLGAAIDFIQQNTTPGGVVTKTAGRATIVKVNEAKGLSVLEELTGRTLEIVSKIEAGEIPS